MDYYDTYVQHTGEPTDEELAWWIGLGCHKYIEHHYCPNCDGLETSRLRQDEKYWMCHSCVIWWHEDETNVGGTDV